MLRGMLKKERKTLLRLAVTQRCGLTSSTSGQRLRGNGAKRW